MCRYSPKLRTLYTITIYVAILHLLFHQKSLSTGIPVQFSRTNFFFTIYVVLLQLPFDPYTLSTGIPLHFPQYKIIVTIHLAVLRLLFDPYTLSTSNPLQLPKKKNVCNNTFSSITVTDPSIQVMYRYSPSFPKV